jgi:hypothetical protein
MIHRNRMTDRRSPGEEKLFSERTAAVAKLLAQSLCRKRQYLRNSPRFELGSESICLRWLESSFCGE